MGCQQFVYTVCWHYAQRLAAWRRWHSRKPKFSTMFRATFAKLLVVGSAVYKEKTRQVC